MKRSILLVSATAALLIATFAFAAQRSSNDKDANKAEWEYLVIVGGRQSVTSTSNTKMSKLGLDTSFREYFPLEMNLDKLGAEGWELVTVVMTRDEPIYYLKRVKDSTR